MQSYPAKMQIKNWNDLRYLLALKRGANLSAAARLTGVNDTTVARRLAVLQSSSPAPLWIRHTNGTLHLTPAGEEIAARIEAMEHQVDLMADTLGSNPGGCAGTVRLTSVPILINRLLAPSAGELLGAQPELQIELVADGRDLSLTQREADLAIRLARPATGGTSIKARRIGQLDYAVYAARSRTDGAARRLPWITHEDAMAHVPQAQWIARHGKGFASGLSGLRVHDGETALEAVIAGHGKSLFPRLVASRLGGLREVEMPSDTDLPSREIWLLAHRDQLVLQRIRTVIAWIERTFRAQTPQP